MEPGEARGLWLTCDNSPLRCKTQVSQRTVEVQKLTRHLLSDKAFAFRTEPVQVHQNPSCRKQVKMKGLA